MFTKQDQLILRELSKYVHDIAQMPHQEKLRNMWRKHTALKGELPPIFVSPEGSWDEILPWDRMQCEDPFAREVERQLRMRIFRHEHIKDDVPVEDHFDIPVGCIPIN